jgi:glycosyltransferase involved in cell wall biosynthesis
MKEIYIIMPAYNEASVISQAIRDILKIKVEGYDKPKVIVVNDFSQDETSSVAIKNGAYQVLDHIVNLGAGGATRTGLRFALQESADQKESIFITMDSDGQHAGKDIQNVISEIESKKADIVVGSRLHEKNTKNMPWYRKFGNNFLTYVSRAMFGIKVKDTQSGMRAYTRSGVQAIIDFQSDRYSFCTETLWMANKANLKVVETPISVIYSDYSLEKGQSNWNAFNLVLELLWLKVSR